MTVNSLSEPINWELVPENEQIRMFRGNDLPLPPELISKILAEVPISDRSNFSLTSRSFYKVANSPDYWAVQAKKFALLWELCAPSISNEENRAKNAIMSMRKLTLDVYHKLRKTFPNDTNLLINLINSCITVKDAPHETLENALLRYDVLLNSSLYRILADMPEISLNLIKHVKHERVGIVAKLFFADLQERSGKTFECDYIAELKEHLRNRSRDASIIFYGSMHNPGLLGKLFDGNLTSNYAPSRLISDLEAWLELPKMQNCNRKHFVDVLFTFPGLLPNNEVMRRYRELLVKYLGVCGYLKFCIENYHPDFKNNTYRMDYTHKMIRQAHRKDSQLSMGNEHDLTFVLWHLSHCQFREAIVHMRLWVDDPAFQLACAIALLSILPWLFVMPAIVFSIRHLSKPVFSIVTNQLSLVQSRYISSILKVGIFFVSLVSGASLLLSCCLMTCVLPAIHVQIFFKFAAQLLRSIQNCYAIHRQIQSEQANAVVQNAQHNLKN
ncbi:MAG: F-box protein [Chlamydiales bacterium]|nr:F-box protein [Chlamydiales bacterium]